MFFFIHYVIAGLSMTVVELFTDIRGLKAVLHKAFYKDTSGFFKLKKKAKQQRNRSQRFSLFEILELDVIASRKWSCTGSDKAKFKHRRQKCPHSRSK